MQRPHSPRQDPHSSEPQPQTPHIQHAPSSDPRARPLKDSTYLADPLATSASGTGTESKSDQGLLFSSPDGAAPSSQSLRSPHTLDTPITPPIDVDITKPRAAGDGMATDAAIGTGLHQPVISSDPPPPPTGVESPSRPPLIALHDSSTSLSSDPDEQQPARKNIRAWAKATTAGAPPDTPSPSEDALLSHQSSDESLDRQSLTRSVGHKSASPVSHGDGSRRSGQGSGTSSGDEYSSGNMLSSGHLADIESGASGSGSGSRPENHANLSPRSSPRTRFPRLPLAAVAHFETSSSESDAPAILAAHVLPQSHHNRIDRRQHRHSPPHSSSRRRHRDRDRDRDRERRARPSNPTTTALPSVPIYAPQLHLSPPPPPLPPLRPLRVITDGFDVLDEISRMLHYSRRPLLRYNEDSTGFVFRRRENDVLDDIQAMIQMASVP